MSDPFNDHTHGDFLPVRTVTEKYHDEIVHCALVEIAKRDKRIAKLETALEKIVSDELYNESQMSVIAEAALKDNGGD